MPFALRLEQAGSSVRGNFQTDSVLIDVSGNQDESGSVSLEGSAPGLGPYDYVGAASLVKFRARVDPTAGLTGDLEYRLDRTAETPLGPSTVYTGSIAAAQRLATPAPLTFEGTWSGRFIVRSCTATCLPPHVDEISVFRLTLEQRGGVVSGVIELATSEPPIPVSGHVDGNRLILDRSGFDTAFRILEWSTQRDPYGRMVGAFSYEQRTASAQSSNVIRRDAELGAVALVP